MTGFDQAELKLLTDLIQERFGLTFNGIRLEILEARLRPRLRELHLTNLRDYYHHLRFHPDLPDVMTSCHRQVSGRAGNLSM